MTQNNNDQNVSTPLNWARSTMSISARITPFVWSQLQKPSKLKGLDYFGNCSKAKILENYVQYCLELERKVKALNERLSLK